MNATETKELDQRPLTVYKASAGSGKTFTLAVEYIKLLIRDPQNYRYILAVTFTNKATQEMKMRILSKLYGIAHGLPDSTDYLTEISKAFPQYNELSWCITSTTSAWRRLTASSSVSCATWLGNST